MPSIDIRTRDGQIFKVDEFVQKFSPVVRKALENQGRKPLRKPDLDFRLVRVETLERVLKWMEYHKDEELDQSAKVDFEDIPAWDRDFLNLEKEILFDIMQASELLEIRLLREYAFKVMFSKIPNKTCQGLRSFFDINEQKQNSGENKEVNKQDFGNNKDSNASNKDQDYGKIKDTVEQIPDEVGMVNGDKEYRNVEELNAAESKRQGNEAFVDLHRDNRDEVNDGKIQDIEAVAEGEHQLEKEMITSNLGKEGEISEDHVEVIQDSIEDEHPTLIEKLASSESVHEYDKQMMNQSEDMKDPCEIVRKISGDHVEISQDSIEDEHPMPVENLANIESVHEEKTNIAEDIKDPCEITVEISEDHVEVIQDTIEDEHQMPTDILSNSESVSEKEANLPEDIKDPCDIMGKISDDHVEITKTPIDDVQFQKENFISSEDKHDVAEAKKIPCDDLKDNDGNVDEIKQDRGEIIEGSSVDEKKIQKENVTLQDANDVAEGDEKHGNGIKDHDENLNEVNEDQIEDIQASIEDEHQITEKILTTSKDGHEHNDDNAENDQNSGENEGNALEHD